VGLDDDTITEEEITGFVKGVGGVGIIKGKNLRSRKEGSVPGLSSVLERLWFDDSMFVMAGGEDDEDEDEDMEGKYWPESGKREIGMYLAIMAAERFFERTKRWPGTEAGKEEGDEEEIKMLVKGIIETAIPEKKGEELLSVVIESISEV
jgi:hypothetical protein